MARRASGEGSYFKRPDGSHGGCIRLNGKRVFRYAQTKGEVKKKLEEVRRQAEQGLSTNYDRQTVKEYLEHWLEQYVKKKNSFAHYQRSEQLVRLQIVPHIGHMQLAKLTPEAVQVMLNKVEGAGFAPRTVRNARAVLRRALNQAMRWGRLSRNVATLVEVPQAKTPTIRVLTKDEIRQVLETVRGHRLEVLYWIGIHLGARQGELLGLATCDVNLDKKTLRVERSLQLQKGKIVIIPPKTKASTRTLPLSDRLVELLRALLARIQTEKTNGRPQWNGLDLLFGKHDGTPTKVYNAVNHFKSVCKQVGLTGFRFHDMRHTCATHLLHAGVSPRVVMEILGHNQISTTLNIYTHVMEETLRAAVDALEQVFDF